MTRNKLYAAVVEFERLVDGTQNHIHLRMQSDGSFSVDKQTGYCVSEAEFNHKPGAELTLKHKQGNGQSNLPEDWFDEEGDCWDAVDQLIREYQLDVDKP